MSETVVEETDPENNQPTEAVQVETEASADEPDSNPEATGTGNEDAQTEEVEAQQPEQGGATSKARKEAARYRAQLRTVETRANAMRDQLIEHELGSNGVKIAALIAAGVDLDTLIGEDGRVSTEAVQTAAATTRETLGIPTNRFTGTADQGGGRGTMPTKAAPTWGNLLDPTNPQVKR